MFLSDIVGVGLKPATTQHSPVRRQGFHASKFQSTHLISAVVKVLLLIFSGSLHMHILHLCLEYVTDRWPRSDGIKLNMLKICREYWNFSKCRDTQLCRLTALCRK